MVLRIQYSFLKSVRFTNTTAKAFPYSARFLSQELHIYTVAKFYRLTYV